MAFDFFVTSPFDSRVFILSWHVFVLICRFLMNFALYAFMMVFVSTSCLQYLRMFLCNFSLWNALFALCYENCMIKIMNSFVLLVFSSRVIDFSDLLSFEIVRLSYLGKRVFISGSVASLLIFLFSTL